MQDEKFQVNKIQSNSRFSLFYIFVSSAVFVFVHLKALNSCMKKKYILYAKRGNFAVEQMMSGNDFFSQVNFLSQS